MRRGWWLAFGLAIGCATPTPAPTVTPAPASAPAPTPMPKPSSLLLTHADRLLVQGDYDQARQAYSDFARQYPDDGATPRVVATRDVLGTLATARDELTRLDAEVLGMKAQAQDTERELDRLRRDLAARAAELARVQKELAERQAELARLIGEAEQLRTDLEKLKSVDLRLERRR